MNSTRPIYNICPIKMILVINKHKNSLLTPNIFDLAELAELALARISSLQTQSQ